MHYPKVVLFLSDDWARTPFVKVEASFRRQRLAERCEQEGHENTLYSIVAKMSICCSIDLLINLSLGSLLFRIRCGTIV